MGWDQAGATERTVLAWERTAIMSIAVAALLARAGVVQRRLGLAIPTAALLVLTGVIEWFFSQRIYLERARSYADGAIGHGRVVVLVGVVTLITAAGSAVLALGG